MDLYSKSAPKRHFVPVWMLFFLLAGCADTKWPSWMTGEPADSVINAPRAVSRPEKSKDRKWPLLGEIPEDKPVFSTPSDLAQKEESLQSDKFKAQAESERLRNVPLPDSLEPKHEKAPFVSEEERIPAVPEAPAPLVESDAPVEAPVLPKENKSPFFSALR